MAGRPLQSFHVVGSEHLAPHMVRVVLGSNSFDAFVPSKFTDSYIKLVFVHDDLNEEVVAALPHPLTLDSFADVPPEKKPSVRTITVRRVDVEARQIAVDIVTHGEHGVAGQWAASAQPGQPIYLMGPGGAYTPDPAADWHLLAGPRQTVVFYMGVSQLANITAKLRHAGAKPGLPIAIIERATLPEQRTFRGTLETIEAVAHAAAVTAPALLIVGDVAAFNAVDSLLTPTDQARSMSHGAFV